MAGSLAAILNYEDKGHSLGLAELRQKDPGLLRLDKLAHQPCIPYTQTYVKEKQDSILSYHYPEMTVSVQTNPHAKVNRDLKTQKPTNVVVWI